MSHVSKETNQLALDLVVAEYNTIRAEVHHALEYAQGIVKWSIGIFGAVLAAALVAAHSAGQVRGYSFLGIAVLVLFGFALPGVMWAAAWTWLGELVRMERAGAYLREFELRVSKIPKITSALGFTPLNWETRIFAERKSKGSMKKQIAAYLGTAVLFFGSTAISLCMFVAWWGRLFSWEFSTTEFHRGWLIVAGTFEVVCILFAFYLFRSLRRLGNPRNSSNGAKISHRRS